MESIIKIHAWLTCSSTGRPCKPSQGFSLLEIVVAIALLALLMAIGVPALNRFRPGYERNAFVSTLSALVQRTWQDAQITHKTHRIRFDIPHRTVIAEREMGKNDMGEVQYQEVSSQYIQSRITWPAHIQIKDVFIDGIDQMHKPGMPGFKVEEVWFYVYADGSIQEVIINMFDTTDASQAEAGTRLGLVLSPFTAKFTAYDTFQQP